MSIQHKFLFDQNRGWLSDKIHLLYEKFRSICFTEKPRDLVCDRTRILQIRQLISIRVDTLPIRCDKTEIGMCKEGIHHDRNLIRHKEIIVHQPVDVSRILIVIVAGTCPILRCSIRGMMFVVNARGVCKIPPHYVRRLRVM